MKKKRSTRRVWLLRGVLLIVVLFVGLLLAARYYASRLGPLVKQQALAYLRERYAAEVEFRDFQVTMPVRSPLQWLRSRGKEARVDARIAGLSLRHHGRRDLPPLFVVESASFQLDLRSLFEQPAQVSHVRLQGLVVHIPPRTPSLAPHKDVPRSIPRRLPRSKPLPNSPPEKADSPIQTLPPAPLTVRIEEIVADGARLILLPREKNKAPLEFLLHRLRLHSAGVNVPLRFEAQVTNPKPPGLIQTTGGFGPWSRDEPATSPITGVYRFEKADLSVFKGIAGTLASTGKFSGRLAEITVDGEAHVPDFRLRRSGNKLPLRTQFHALVDGTNGNTLLEPVRARLGDTSFTVKGGVVKYAGARGRTVALDVSMPKGRLEDVLVLALPGDRPMLQGGVKLETTVILPPGAGDIADRLELNGSFELIDAAFTSPTVQQKIDELSRRGSGQPSNTLLSRVPAQMAGRFHLADGIISFPELRFLVPGAAVHLAGRYTFATEQVDFSGTLRLDAKISETQTGWKRWVLKPADPFFAKKGAGTFLNIQIVGHRSSPRFARAKSPRSP